jgi:subtilisin-like proprotein convertase family protein
MSEPGTNRLELTLPNGKRMAVVYEGEAKATEMAILLDDWAEHWGENNWGEWEGE